MPDYSTATFNDSDYRLNEAPISDQLFKTLLCINEDNGGEDLSRLFIPLTWLLDNFTGSTIKFDERLMLYLKGTITKNVKLLFLDYQLIEMKGMMSMFSSKKGPGDTALNIYYENDLAQINECYESLKKLEARVRQLLVEFPENAMLNNILESIVKFSSLPLSAPQMQLATFLEKILGRFCEYIF